MRSVIRSALAALVLYAVPALAQDLGVLDAYAITAVPGAKTGSAYMLIHNHALAPDRLLGASSPVADRVEIHENVEENGVISMRHVEEGLELRPDSVLLLNRGGPHLMFLGITDPFEDGDTIPVTLTFENAGDIAIEVPVELGRLTDDPEGGHQHGQEDGHAMEGMDHGSMEGMDHEHMEGQGG